MTDRELLLELIGYAEMMDSYSAEYRAFQEKYRYENHKPITSQLLTRHAEAIARVKSRDEAKELRSRIAELEGENHKLSETLATKQAAWHIHAADIQQRIGAKSQKISELTGELARVKAQRSQSDLLEECRRMAKELYPEANIWLGTYRGVEVGVIDIQKPCLGEASLPDLHAKLTAALAERDPKAKARAAVETFRSFLTSSDSISRDRANELCDTIRNGLDN
jgi:hypothetical protein